MVLLGAGLRISYYYAAGRGTSSVGEIKLSIRVVDESIQWKRVVPTRPIVTDRSWF